MKRLSILGTVLLVSACGLDAQSQPQQATSDRSSTIKSTSQEVILDIVFRDKKGKAVRSIKPEEIHITEDGVEQSLTSFRLIEGTQLANATTPVAAPESSKPATFDPLREIRLITLVFEGLDGDGKRFFRQALKDVLGMAPEQNLYFSVLTIDQKLHVVQPFTSDHAALIKSVDKSMMWSFTQYETQSTEIKESLKQQLSSGEPELQGTSGVGGGGPSASQIQSAVNYRMAKMQYDMLQAAEATDRNANARMTVDALMTLVRAQSQLPGRKVVLYFNPYLFIPEVIKEQYNSLVGLANRSNVSFYTVDPKGLVTWSQEGAGRDFLKGATGEIRSQQMRGGVGEVSTAQARAVETAEGALRSNPLLWLRDLAQQTGGTAIVETNDWKAPLRTVMDEVRTYYEASYTPHITAYDGKFRKISIRVDRPDVIAHTSSGYFALPQLKEGQQLYAYEMPLLNAINSPSIPSDIPFQLAAERFNDRGPKVEYMVTLEAPLKEMTFSPMPDQKNSAIDAGLLAVLRNSKGEIIEKFSKNVAVQVAVDKVSAYQEGNLVQTFRTELAPGTYGLEAAMMDRNGKRLGVKKTQLTVDAPSNRLSMSDVVVVRRADTLKDNQILDAFYFQGGKVVPTLAHTLKGGPGNILSFYFAVYPNRTITDSPKLTMQFYRDSQYLGPAEIPLPVPEKDGRIPFIASLPADKFTPGSYEIRVGVTQGGSAVERRISFQIN
jgi:VWFA-related protein